MIHLALKTSLMGQNKLKKYFSILIYFLLITSCQYQWVEKKHIKLEKVSFGSSIKDSFKNKTVRYFSAGASKDNMSLKILNINFRKKNFYGGIAARAKQIEVIGWTIATGSLSIEPLAFFLIIFFWTPSHFWALSLYKSDDYKKANIPMLPLTNGIESTKINIFIYSLFMVPVIVFPYYINFAGLTFLIPSLILTFYYNTLCYELYNFKKNKFDPKKAKSIFGYSILYLFLVFVLFLIDKII